MLDIFIAEWLQWPQLNVNEETAGACLWREYFIVFVINIFFHNLLTV